MDIIVCNWAATGVPGGSGGPGGPGGPVGPGSPGGPGGQGCLGGQSGPDDQVCQCIWFARSKQSNYRENLRCHTCDTLTHGHGKVGQYPV